MDPFDVLDVGRMAMVQDPTGAVVALWEPRRHAGAGLAGEANAICWNELATTDTGRAGRVLHVAVRLVQRNAEMGTGTYTMFTHAGAPARRHDGDPGGPRPRAAALEDLLRGERLRRADDPGSVPWRLGTVPTHRCGRGRPVLRVADPQGAVFAVIQPTASQEAAGLDCTAWTPSRPSSGGLRSAASVPTPCPASHIERLLDCAVRAPNHKLTEPWRFAVLTGAARGAYAEVRAGTGSSATPIRLVGGGRGRREGAPGGAGDAGLHGGDVGREPGRVTREEDYAAVMMAMRTS